MSSLNWLVIFGTGFVPLIVGAIWYGPLFSNAWMKEADMSLEKIQGANMMKIYGLALLFSFMFALGIFPYMIHQMGVFSTLEGLEVDKPGTEAYIYAQDFIAKYGNEFRTFKHGALHGSILGILVILPILGTNALFERKSWKYILINTGYWTVCALIMGGIISAWA